MMPQLQKDPSKSESQDYLDELVLQAAPISNRAEWRWDLAEADLRTIISIDGATQTLALPAPFIIRGLLDVDSRQPLVTKVTAAINHIGGMLLADTSTFSKMPISSVPRRICAVRAHSMPALDELLSADAIELQLIDDCRGSFLVNERPVVLPKWPIDVPDVERLRTKIQLLRKLSGEPIPIGVAMHAGNVQQDVATMVGCGVDFISLLMPMESSRLPIPWIVSTARNAVNSAGRPQVSIWVEADVRDGWDIAKLFACGASAIILDPVIQPWVNNEDLPEETLSSSGIRRSTGLATREEVVEAYLSSLRGKLVKLMQQIQQSLQLCGCSRLAELNMEHLVATTEHAHRLCGAPLLGSSSFKTP